MTKSNQISLIVMSVIALLFATPYWFVLRSGYGIKFAIAAFFALCLLSRIHASFDVEPSLRDDVIGYYLYHYSLYTSGLLWLFMAYQAVFFIMHWGKILYYRKTIPSAWYMGTMPMQSDDIPSGVSNVSLSVIFIAVVVSYTVEGFSTPVSVYHAATVFAVGLPACLLMIYIERKSEGIFPLHVLDTYHHRNRSKLCAHSMREKDNLSAIFSRRDKALKKITIKR